MENVNDASDYTLYIRNTSVYPVRISVGQNYPSSIALDSGQVMNFPLDKVETITASSYGKYTHFLSGIVAELNLKGLLNENADIKSDNLLINIAYEKGSKGGILWNLARYLFTQGKWALYLEPLNPKDLIMSDTIEDCTKKLYEIIGSQATSEKIAHDAALVWSMFPRAADKILEKKSVYPFNILGLDIGGFIASDDQLRNWADQLYTSLYKRFSHIDNKAIWNAVNMLIIDSVESLREGKYYAHRDPTYLVTLLRRSDAIQDTSDLINKDIITQLKSRTKDESSLALLAKLEAAVFQTSNTSHFIPPAPPLPAIQKNNNMGKSYKEKAVLRFLHELKNKRPEEQTLLDKVVWRIFKLIHETSQEQVTLKYAALDKLKLIEQHKHCIKQLGQINEFITPAMINMVKGEKKPTFAIQEWLVRLGQCERKKAFQYAQLGLQDLQKLVKEEDKDRDYQVLLMSHLQQQIAKFQEPD